MSRRTVVIVNDQAHISGGAPFVAINSARSLAEDGWEVIFFAGVGPIASELEHPGIRVECLGQQEILHDPNRLRAATQGLWNLPAARALRRVLATCDRATTIVHLHGWMKCLSPSVLPVGHEMGFKVVITAHDFFLSCPTGGFYDFRKEAVCPLRPLSLECLRTSCDSRSYPQKLWRSARTAAQHYLTGAEKCADIIIAVSEFEDRILDRYLAPVERVVVENPAPAPREDRRPRQEGAPFIYVGRLSAEKGIGILIDALSEGNHSCRFIGAGPLEAEIRARLPRAEISGWLPRDQVFEAMREGWALLFPSVWYETAGLVVIEAASQGLPAIVSDGCAASAYIEDGRTGSLFSAGSSEDLRRCLSLFASDHAEAMSRNAYDWYWADPWTQERHLRALVPIYHRMLS